ncbi:hypothetical protein AAFF_G00298690 [Aldrovandia affinis]|uniref:Uncharacterized protein n=1 Tax=Aldrovandia affinis TaxID=143900 RepID=A0AAD7R952_9TELE|nr:hypothetical protein AAFF_G00298690 [Aldrovandia affinis]
MGLRMPAGVAEMTHQIPEELKRNSRGRRGRGRRARQRKTKARREKRRFKPYLPSIIMGNVRSLANKMDELTALARSQAEFRECSIMCFTESWLHKDIPDNNVSVDGFQTVRGDRDCIESVKKQPVTTKTVRRWSEEAMEALRGCFEVTDWQALSEPRGDDIDGLTGCLTDYINFCVDCNVPTRTIKCYPNNKPWITKDIKIILNAKKRAFRAGDKDGVKTIQGELRVTIREAKEKYRRKLEGKLQQNNMKEVWSGMKAITGFKQAGGGGGGWGG